MRVVKEAYTENCKVVFDPEYVTIQHAAGGEPVHMSIAEAKEVVEWLSHELNRVLPEIMPVREYATPLAGWDKEMGRALEQLGKTTAKAHTGPVYDPGPRTATQTVEVKVGDPNLAYRHIGGRTAHQGDGATEVADLGVLAEKVGRV